MAEDLIQLMWKDMGDCECFSLQSDESMNVSDLVLICIFIRMVFSDITAKVELLAVLSIKDSREEMTYFNCLKTLRKSSAPRIQIGVYRHG